MKRRKFLKNLVNVMGGYILYSNLEAIAQNQDSEKNENYISHNYEIIKQGIYEHYKGYVDYVAPVSGTIRENIKAKGGDGEGWEEKGKDEVAKDYTGSHMFYVDFAVRFVDKKIEDVPEDEFRKLAKKLVKHQKENSKGTHIDYSKKCVEDAYFNLSKVKVKYFQKLLSSEKNSNNYYELVRSAFSRQEYKSYLEEWDKIRENLYDSFIKAFDFAAWLYNLTSNGKASEKVNAVRNRGKEYNFSTLDKIYGQE
jgi:hypothetical protein